MQNNIPFHFEAVFQYFSWGLRRNYFILSAFLRSFFAFFFLPCSTVDWLAFNVRCACSTGFPLNVEESENYQKSEKSETSNGGEVPLFLWYTYTGFKIVDLICVSLAQSIPAYFALYPKNTLLSSKMASQVVQWPWSSRPGFVDFRKWWVKSTPGKQKYIYKIYQSSHSKLFVKIFFMV